MLVQVNGDRIVVKDFSARSQIVRNVIGRFSVSRECRAYEGLEGVTGIPVFHGRIDSYAFAYAFVQGRSLPSFERRSMPRSFFQALERLLDAVHDRQVAICDLHHRNVIAEERTGLPYLVDFSISLRRPPAWNLPGRWVFERSKRLDRFALMRIRRRYEVPEADGRAIAASIPSSAPAAEESVDSMTSSSDAALLRLHAWGRLLKRFLRRARGKA